MKNQHQVIFKVLLIIMLLFAYRVYAQKKVITAQSGQGKLQPILTQTQKDLITKIHNKEKISRKELKDWILIINQKLREGEINLTNCNGSLVERINKSLLEKC